MTSIDLSLLLPAYNEAPNLPAVVEEITTQLASTDLDYEIVVVDDGSSDGTIDVLADLGTRYERLRWLSFRRNSGKSEALQAGFALTRGKVVVLMDADGQDDPAAIPTLLAALDGGLDLVTGRRSQRNDRFIKRSTSKLYNWMTSKITGVPGRDFNSGLKAIRRDLVDELDLYGELHRYIPVLAASSGFAVGEVDVPHRARLHGESKFGRARFWRGFFDLVTVKFLTTYKTRPFHILGGVGLGCGGLGSLLLVWMLVDKLNGHAIGSRPALIAGVLFVLVGLQFASLGLLAELIVYRTRGVVVSRPVIAASARVDAGAEDRSRVVSAP
ncbi:MAG TPA: glycosyltransferase family 2 protein [Acidimicrobiia bacterium]|nr:glycosyltransferase family 2 protein [Acidimicrobiia bacterium]